MCILVPSKGAEAQKMKKSSYQVYQVKKGSIQVIKWIAGSTRSAGMLFNVKFTPFSIFAHCGSARARTHTQCWMYKERMMLITQDHIADKKSMISHQICW